ncbi:hypothetical protein [Arthrobacter sp. NIO-1057]|uniref:hypothetical protein n=1 Tax=Arthrobacter sp. NIO-1057 TaxID=993071 RepID=UPI00071E365B|nr:hypothetical protein [Arthrobacter sp. NIO-1057]KSU65984.1 hypothetical protein AS038_09885 [Arthrobacter sp. NIO-1057]SCC29206.1 hypothetical protein GA0061084_2012 [Arthrobacter sp. NIO-1057]
MSFKKKLSALLMSLALVTGTAVAGAVPASAGTSIGATYNGASHVYYKFYASTNTFCIKKKTNTSYSAMVLIYKDGKQIYNLQTNMVNEWACVDLDKYAKVEGKKLTFKLSMFYKSERVYRSSTGYAYA